MSSVNVIIIDGKKKMSVEMHYTEAKHIIENDIKRKLKKYLVNYKGFGYHPEPIDAGIVIFNLREKFIDAKDQGGFGASTLKNFPIGWKMSDTEFGIVDYDKWKKVRKKWLNDYKKSFGRKYEEW